MCDTRPHMVFCVSISSTVSAVLLGCFAEGHGTRPSMCARSPVLAGSSTERYTGIWTRGRPSHAALSVSRWPDTSFSTNRAHPCRGVQTTNQVGWIIMQELRPRQPRREKAHPTSTNSRAIPSASHLDPEATITRPSIHTAKAFSSIHSIPTYFRSANLESIA